MTLTRKLFAFAAAGALAATASQAQSRLIALTEGLSPAVTAPVVLQRDFQNCQVERRCSPLNFPTAAARHAGGTAHDPRDGGTWISDGTRLAKVTPDGCDYICPPAPAPGASATTLVTGLAMEESENRLFVVDSDGNLTVLNIPKGRCQPAVVARCRISVPLGQGMFFSGLAVDESRNYLFYSASNFLGTSVSQAVYVARTSDPCNPICAVRMAPCANGTPLRGITGLAFDPCNSVLWATDGQQFVSADFSVDPVGGCIANNYQCCGTPLNLARAVGLCIAPEGATPRGQPCSSAVCGNCAPRHFLSGDPTIGNPALDFVVENAPAASRAFLAINSGPCQLPGAAIPGFCGRFYVQLAPLPPIVVGPFPTNGGLPGTCTGSATARVVVPAEPSLCGDPFASQFIGLCFASSGTLGTFMSNCLEFSLGGS